MLLEYSTNDFKIPHTSTCHIMNTGDINDGDTVTITSPIFASIDFTSGAFNVKSTFNVPIRIQNADKSIHIPDDTTNVGYPSTLVCDDNDVFNMYVKA